MTLLLPVFALLTGIAVLAVLWPMFKRHPLVPRDRFELAIYRDQLAEVERDRERGLVPEDQARAARLEIERRLLRAAAIERQSPDGSTGRRGPVLAAALLVPLFATTLYAVLGSPGLPDRPLASRQDEPKPQQQPDVAEMVAKLEARLATAPDDLEGWLMLGRSRAVMGNLPGAVEAFRRAHALAPDDPAAIGGLAEAMTTAGGGVMPVEAKGLFERLAQLQPDDPRPDFYLAWADLQAGEARRALDRWTGLLARAPADAPWRQQVVEGIQAAAGQLGIDPKTVLAEMPPAPSSAPQPTREQMDAVSKMTPDEQIVMIRGMVDKLQARMDADGSDVQGWLRLAQSRMVLGETDRARDTYQKALALHPDAPVLLKGYAALLIGPAPDGADLPRVGDQANELLTRAAKLQPEDPEIWWFLGIRALQDGRKDEARSAWEKVLARLDPSLPEYQDVKSRIDSLGG
ncbi:MAG: c-type cytochrome biogenesis protein CcmI [Geminicoccaceae bacterium]